ncbi:MAG: Uma2 family endonuclease [Tetrasphaera sp.]
MTTLPRSRPLTRADLDAMPDDGHRYELIDGVLVVTPAPARRHQRAVVRLVLALHRDFPADYEILPAPFDVALADDTALQPDVLIARRQDLTERNLPGAPLLAVEVLSPSTRRFDLLLKRSRYEAAGCASYWVIDPDEPSITAWDLRDGAYVVAGRATGAEELTLQLPYAVTIRPADLVA